jgi:RNA polymerase sigma factor (sigma-70 family)
MSEPTPISDQELIQACRAGDSVAWERVLAQYERLVYSIPLNYGLAREDAADIAQLTFTNLLQSLDRLSPDSRLGAWLATVARRNTWRVIERQRRTNEVALGEVEEHAVEQDDVQADQVERWERLEWLNSALAQLPERCRTLLLALYFSQSEPSYAEIAETLGAPIGSIGPTRARCLERLKLLLQL